MTAFPEGSVSPASSGSARSARKRGPLLIETYALDLLEGPKGEVFDRSPPPELQ